MIIPKNKSVLITGASTGIGRVTALYLSRSGVRVFAGVRKESDGQSLIKESSGNIVPVILDVTDRLSIENTYAFICKKTDKEGFCGIVNNAGVAFGGPFEFIDIEDVKKLFDVNLFGAMEITKTFIPLLRKNSGRIVNISSISGRMALPFVSPYTASKFALKAFSDSIRAELTPWNISVSLIEPGDVKTPIWEKTAGNISKTIGSLPDEAIKHYGPVYEKINQVKCHGIPPEKIAKKIAHALFHDSPKPRYLIGSDAKALWFIDKLPIKIRNTIIFFFLPKYGK